MSQSFDDEVLREMRKRDAYDDGCQAYMRAKNLDANPYSNSDDEWDLYTAWRDGWTDTAWDD
jgi:hypothetical protein